MKIPLQNPKTPKPQNPIRLFVIIIIYLNFKMVEADPFRDEDFYHIEQIKWLSLCRRGLR